METFKLNVRKSFTPSPVFIDGLSRCGKAAVSVAVSSFERVEHVKNRFVFDQLQTYYENSWMERGAVMEQLITEVDFELYHSLLGRNLNWNKHDWSGVENSREPEKYRLRLETKDNAQNAEKIFRHIDRNQLIALNTTQEMLFFYDLYDDCFERRNKTIVVLRHPIEVVFSWHRTHRGTRFGTDKRFLHPTVMYNETPIPLEASQFPELYLNSSPLYRIILLLSSKYDRYISVLNGLPQHQKERTFVIGFDDFTSNTGQYLQSLQEFLGTEASDMTERMCLNQRLPRDNNSNEVLEKLRAIKHHLSKDEFKYFHNCCIEYEENFETNIKIDDYLSNNLKGIKYNNFDEYISHKPDFNYGKRIN